MKKLYIIKIGGNVTDNSEALQKFLSDFSAIDSPKILVHGGGKSASELAAKLGVSQAMVNGRRITDLETLKIATMVYAGWINKSIVAQLQTAGTNALGLSGADCNVIQSQKRPVVDIDYGFVGDIVHVDTKRISQFLEMGITPVVSAITANAAGQLLNTNADTIASKLAVSMNELYKTELIYCFEKKGVLKNSDDDRTLIKKINLEDYKKLIKAQRIVKGMIPKLDNAFDALQNKTSNVIIGNAGELNQLIATKHAGTKLYL